MHKCTKLQLTRNYYYSTEIVKSNFFDGHTNVRKLLMRHVIYIPIVILNSFATEHTDRERAKEKEKHIVRRAYTSKKCHLTTWPNKSRTV